jgi:hypothetical protein
MVLPEASAGVGYSDPPCLVHVVHKMYCPTALREFATALRAHPPGDCELVLLVKGFASRTQAKAYLAEVADLAPQIMFMPDRGFDLGSHFAAAVHLRRHRYCFVKSQFRPLADDWLVKLDAALDRPGVGQVGPTGVWLSSHSWLTYSIGLPSVYRSLLPPRREVRELMSKIQLEQGSIERPSTGHLMRMRLKALLNAPEDLWSFGPFPNPHLRTSAFMITHAALRELRLFEVRSKRDAYALESGRESITCQLERMGLSSLVVDRAGAVYEPNQWHRSCTFYQGDQERLLVAEDHSDRYAVGDLSCRQLLSTLAWGPAADPRPPGESTCDRR